MAPAMDFQGQMVCYCDGHCVVSTMVIDIMITWPQQWLPWCSLIYTLILFVFNVINGVLLWCQQWWLCDVSSADCDITVTWPQQWLLWSLISHMPHHCLRMTLCNCLQCNQWCAVVISTMVIVTSWSHDFNNGLLLWSLVSPLVSQSGLSSSCSQAGGAAGERWGRHVHRGRWWKAGNKGFINPLHANFFQQNHKDPW